MRRAAVVSVLIALAVPFAAGASGTDVVHAPRPPGATAKQWGADLYAANCLRCHGTNGEGTPSSGPSLRGVGAQAADFYLRTGYMPLAAPGDQPHRADVQLSPREIVALEAYVASLGHGPPVPKPHPERGRLCRGSGALHRSLRRVPSGRRPRRLREGRSRARARQATADADRRGGADRAVPHAALLARSRSPTGSSTRSSPTSATRSIPTTRRMGPRPPRAGAGGLVTWLSRRRLVGPASDRGGARERLVAVSAVVLGGRRRRRVKPPMCRRQPNSRRSPCSPARLALCAAGFVGVYALGAVPHRTQFLGLVARARARPARRSAGRLRQAARPARGAGGGLPAAAGARAGRGGDRRAGLAESGSAPHAQTALDRRRGRRRRGAGRGAARPRRFARPGARRRPVLRDAVAARPEARRRERPAARSPTTSSRARSTPPSPRAPTAS